MKVFSKTDIGRKREINEDYVYISEEPVGNIPNLFVVADGMGGHKAGDFASRYAVRTLEQEIKKSEEMGPERIITNAIRVANEELIREAKENVRHDGMGTTLVVATVIEHTLYFANVGDSRLYLIDDQIHQLSHDHSLVQEMVRLGAIKPEEAKYHPDKNVITRAIGVDKKAEPDFFEHRIKKGDLILMCTDGLSNMMDDMEMFQIIKSSRDIVEAVNRLIEKANENGGKDNIGVVMVEPFAGEVSIW